MLKDMSFRIGDKMMLKCKSDSYWEYCTWKHGDWLCDFEWKFKKDAVKHPTCQALGARGRFVGTYESHECDIELSNVTAADEGVWTCTMQQFKMGAFRLV